MNNVTTKNTTAKTNPALLFKTPMYFYCLLCIPCKMYNRQAVIFLVYLLKLETIFYSKLL